MDSPAAGEAADSARFGLLGPLLVTGVAGQVAVLPSARQRTILAALLVSANRTISVDKLTEILWAGGQPPNAAAAIRNYVMRLRRQAGPAGRRIVSRPGGYAVEVRDHAEFDVAEADLLRREARTRRRLDAGRRPPRCWSPRSRCGAGSRWPTFLPPRSSIGRDHVSPSCDSSSPRRGSMPTCSWAATTTW